MPTVTLTRVLSRHTIEQSCVSNIVFYMGPLLLVKLIKPDAAVLAYYAIRQASGDKAAALNFVASVKDTWRALQGNLTADFLKFQSGKNDARTRNFRVYMCVKLWRWWWW